MSGLHNKFKELFDVNVISIVIGFLIYLVIADWFKVVKSFYSVRMGIDNSHEYSSDSSSDLSFSFIDESDDIQRNISKDRYQVTRRKFASAFVVTLVTVFFIVVMYEWWLMYHEED